MEFEKRKAATMAAMASTEADKSPKGSLDTPIIPLLRTLNRHPLYFTTSSCSGRISIFCHPSASNSLTSNCKRKAKGGSWLFITHELADPDSIVALLFHTAHSAQHSDLVFRFEPLIIAVECKDLSSAQSLVSIAISCGFRESGITSVHKRVIIAIRCSIRLEVPLGDSNRLAVSPDYVRYLVGVANEKMEANRRRTETFLRTLQSKGFEVPLISENHEHLLVSPTVGDENGSTSNVCNNVRVRNASSETTDVNTQLGSLGVHLSRLSVSQTVIHGEPTEKVFLWGHSACTVDHNTNMKVLLFGGFGGMGRHSRRNDCLLLDPLSGNLKSINLMGAPPPRLGHTCSLIGDSMFVIGGRSDPLNILNDVWVLNTVTREWRFLDCTGSVFLPRHRHAAAVVGSKIYVFGGLNNDIIYSSLVVLDTQILHWKEISGHGELPCARHSLSMVAFGSQLFIFGGYNGEKPLGDIYSFDSQTNLWKKENPKGRTPNARFSHSMFLYKNYLGIIGGCPVKHNFQELALLDLRVNFWKHVGLNSSFENLFVRSTTNVVGDELVIIGGGAACYAFGTKFSEPVKINLLPLISLADEVVQSEDYKIHSFHRQLTEKRNKDFQDIGHPMVASHWVLQIERRYAKFGKDLLKKFGWLDLGRKVYSQKDGLNICFPVTDKFCASFYDHQHYSQDAVEELNDFQLFKPFRQEGVLLNGISESKALNLLMACGATKLADELVKERKAPKSPLKIMSEAVASLLSQHGLPPQLLEQLPTRWDRIGDIVVLPVTSFKDQIWDSIAEELWSTIAKSLGAIRLARQGKIAPTGTRDSSLEILVGEDGWVDHCEYGILYSFDATKCMFSWGNLSEKLRMGRLNCTNEIVVDLFAGIGYFVLPFLVRAKAKLVYACEWNPHAVEALRHNLRANSVDNRCVILEGDNRFTAPKGIADRVCLGLLPTSEGSWVTAVRAVRSEGGRLHVHGNVKDTEESLWTEYVSNSIYKIAVSEGLCWEVIIEHVERVKWYAPHIRHLVADVRCRKI